MNGNGTPIMHARDAISAALAECFVTIEGERFNFMQAINLEATFEKKKTEVPILGKPGRGNKATGWSGTGSATFHYNTSIFRRLMQRYKDTGEDVYFDIQVTNEDPTSTVDYWSSSSYLAGSANAGNLGFNSSVVNPLNNNNRAYGFSVRCVQHLCGCFLQ